VKWIHQSFEWICSRFLWGYFNMENLGDPFVSFHDLNGITRKCLGIFLPKINKKWKYWVRIKNSKKCTNSAKSGKNGIWETQKNDLHEAVPKNENRWKLILKEDKISSKRKSSSFFLNKTIYLFQVPLWYVVTFQLQ
jgi:hypothetical protein